MASLNFTETSDGVYVATLTPSEAIRIQIEREKSGILTVYGRIDGLNFCEIRDLPRKENLMFSLDETLIGVDLEIVSSSKVINASTL